MLKSIVEEFLLKGGKVKRRGTRGGELSWKNAASYRDSKKK